MKIWKMKIISCWEYFFSDIEGRIEKTMRENEIYKNKITNQKVFIESLQNIKTILATDFETKQKIIIEYDDWYNWVLVCRKCSGEVVRTGDLKVLSDGYELEILKCKECGLEVIVA